MFKNIVYTHIFFKVENPKKNITIYIFLFIVFYYLLLLLDIVVYV